MTRTGNVADVETVETSPTIDNREDPSNGLRALRFKRLKRAQQAGQFRGASGLAMWVLKFDGRRMTLSQAISSRPSNARSKERPFMVYEQYDFARNPIVEDQEFSLESKCIRCGFSVVARSLEELLEEEKRHRGQCSPKRAAS
jgi:hypothetical protein